MKSIPVTPPRTAGFSLIEMAIVLFIVALLLGGLVPTLSGQVEQKRMNETRQQLEEIQQALLGYAIINGRLPCPASATSNGEEDPLGGGNCNHFYDGFVPAATLGLAGTGSSGFAIDSWGNRMHYAVTSWNSASPALNNVFTTAGGIKTAGLSNLAPNLLVCSAASTSTTSCSAANSSLTASPGVPAVIYSTGKNGGYGGTGLDEAENPNPNSADNDRIFVSHIPTPGTAPNGEFDDIVVWISPNILINRMVAAGRLP
ncbi:MAG: prepilin-type N-terminal cleavage/methylation domain-containing protein [Nitrosomonadales bacterium]|nr:prepilin-type N-terminal cleavage/methylation domain-containing protein [Nitrosomonadales bacterium]